MDFPLTTKEIPKNLSGPNFIALPECHIFPIQDSFPSDLDLWDEDPELQCVLYCKCLDDTMLAGP